MKRRRAVLLVLALVVTLFPVAPASAQGSPGLPGSTGPTRTVTLITGDRVVVGENDRVLGVRMAETRRNVRYLRYALRGREHVVPADAAPLVAKGILDRRLFDITGLVAQGYDDAVQPSVPILVGTAPGTTAAVPGATRTFADLGLTAVVTPKPRAETAWPELRLTALAGQVRKIWLNGKVKPTLDQSVPQVGAPTAWQAGFRGDGVKIAVLDTGYDPTHPDLRSTVEAARDFTADGDVRDTVGHGTHVASTIAGTGAASDGRYTGVAPGARLLIGKVLGQFGGTEEWMIAGMLWAVQQGAKVINMSLGSGPTDGTDPVSLMVNQLSESSGALFVIAAGNNGGYGTVDAPGVADRALTVGSVTKSDQLSVFSSRGPRVGDDGLKPEISAPGSDIVAARAAGTLPAASVDEHHARLSGTSMATPHVAGAAAILAGQHSDWTGEQLKSALIGSAQRIRDADTHGQGAGRVDVARAVAQRVRVEGLAGFGRLWSDSRDTARKVSYINDGDEPVRLRLDLDVRTRAGRPAPGGFSIDRTAITVPARSSTSVTVTARVSDQPAGELSGVLEASGDGDVTLTTPLTAHLAGARHTLTVRTLPRDGELSFALVIVQNERIGWSDGVFTEDGTASFTVPAGRYRTIGLILDERPTMFAQPAALDTLTTVDAKQGRPVTATLDDREARPDAISGGHAIQSDVDSEGPGPTEFVLWSGGDVDRFPMYTLGDPAMHGLRFNHFSYWWHPFAMATVRGAGGFEFEPLYAPWPLEGLAGTITARLVDVGPADPESINKAGDLTGAIALIAPKDWADPSYPPGEQLRSGIELLRTKGARAVISFFNPAHDLPEADAPALPTMMAFYQDSVQRVQDLLRQRPVELDLLTRPNSPVAYFLSDSVSGMPTGPSFRFQRAGLGRVERELRNTTPAGQYKFHLALWNREAVTALAEVEAKWPQRRTDFVSPGSDFGIYAVAGFDDTGELGREESVPVVLRAGERRTSRLFAAPFGPELAQPPVSAQDGKPVPWAYRQGDTLTVAIPMFADSDPSNRALFDAATRGTTVLFKDGKQIARRDDLPALGGFTVPAGPGRFTLIADATRPELVPPLSTRTRAEWTFRAGSGTDGREALPLLDVRFDLPLDDHNRAAVGSLTGTVEVGHQPGSRPSRVRELTVDVSYDDGRTWRRADTARAANRWRVAIPAGGAPGGFATLRATATDTDGNSVTETMIHGYALR